MLVYQDESVGDTSLDVCTSKCCTSRHVRFGLASSTSARIPAAMGAAAEVPEWELVHRLWRSVVVMERPPPLLYVDARADAQFSE